MSARFQIVMLVSSLVFIVLAGIAVIAILTIPALSGNAARNILIAAGASLIVSPFVSWCIARRMQRA